MSSAASDDDEGQKSKLKHALEHLPADVLLEALIEKSSGQSSEEASEVIPSNGDSSEQVVSISVEASQSFSGPIPHPDTLRSYDEVDPGFSNRIVEMAESEQKHRHALQSTALNGTVAEIARGQHYAFLLCLICLLGSIGLIVAGHSVAGTIFAGGTVTGVASMFISGRRRRKPEPNTEDPDED
nr:DUF2335 domain-containing protein [Oceanococcus sp. HetDA_MAG_MS8]